MKLADAAIYDSIKVAEQIYRDTGFPPPLDDDRLNAGGFAFWWQPEFEDLDELIAYQRSDQPASRATVGAGLYQLLPDSLKSADADRVLDAFRRFLRLLNVDELKDVALLRWELQAAASAHDLDRTMEVARKLEAVAPTADNFTLIANAAFQIIHPARTSIPADASSFDPKIRTPEFIEAFHDLFTYVIATMVDARPMGTLDWSPPEKFSADTLDALLVTDSYWARIRNTGVQLTAAQEAMQAWCRFALAAASRDDRAMSEAGRRYLLLPAYPSAELPEKSKLKLNMARWRCEAAARCFAFAGEWSAAIGAVRSWLAVAPEDASAWRRLAEALYKDERISEAIAAFEQYVHHRGDDEDELEANLLLRLGLEANTARARAVSIESAAFTTPFRAQGEALVSWFLPLFSLLSAN